MPVGILPTFRRNPLPPLLKSEGKGRNSLHYVGGLTRGLTVIAAGSENRSGTVGAVKKKCDKRGGGGLKPQNIWCEVTFSTVLPLKQTPRRAELYIIEAEYWRVGPENVIPPAYLVNIFPETSLEIISKKFHCTI